MRKKLSSNNKEGKIKIVDRMPQLDSRQKSMKRSLQVSIKQNKEKPKDDNLVKT